MIVVPVLDDGCRWCALFSLNRSEVIVIDATEPNNAVDVHHLSLTSLVNAMDELLSYADSNWVNGTIQCFDKSSIEMDFDAMLMIGTNDWNGSYTMRY